MMPDPSLAAKTGASGASPFTEPSTSGAEGAEKLGAKKATISCNGVEIDYQASDAKAKFADVMAKAKAAGTYEGKPLGPDGTNPSSEFDRLKLEGLTDEQRCKVVNAKFKTAFKPGFDAGKAA